MSTTYGIVAVALVAVATLGIGAFGLRFSRTTSDFYVASRSVSPVWNSSAIGGEYLSAASFLGVAGLVLAYGADMLWYPIGWTTGYLMLLVFVAAPLRRSGAYTIPDFAQVRLQSVRVREVASVLVVAVGWLYLIPQFQGAGLTLRTVTGAPTWAGTVLVAVIVVINVVSGGMRSITFVQAFQYWLKLTALLIPVFFLLHAWSSDGRPSPVAPQDWFTPLGRTDATGLYLTYSVMIATFLGTMGLPHVVVRFYTNPDGRAARRTTLIVLALLGTFYLLPTIYGVLGRIYAGDLLAAGRTDTVVLELPSRMLGGSTGELLAALLTAGAFAAFLSTSSGLTMSIAGVLGQGLARSEQRPGRRLSTITALRLAAAGGILVPLVLALSAERISVANSVTFAFALAASTFCPLLVLGIWWRGLTAHGAIAGMIGGGLCAGIAPVLTIVWGPDGWLGVLMSQPAAWTVPIGFGLMIGVSLLTRDAVPGNVSRTMVRLHTPEHVDVERQD
ncbi:sodium/solute symporter [Aeromicrobium wangtongii]|uniref:Cation acetate symporter n=1 Tax=Aeromicrobium wangtongii TaxID=2969247 RepID=A0ABY5MBB4_9ACTN|nr:cation acetate symporter [Aeromicrobium wangtongii]MCD9199626.1 cation acetate symporter [Aeromicrobium wangtongii]UUP13978.1 cation acetate symporter [Aeromicrobium wangtongii]